MAKVEYNCPFISHPKSDGLCNPKGCKHWLPEQEDCLWVVQAKAVISLSETAANLVKILASINVDITTIRRR